MAEYFVPSLLQIDQIDYELRIRECRTVRDFESRCRVLGRALISKPFDDLTLSDPLYDFNTEKLQINNTLESLQNAIRNLQHPTVDGVPVKSIRAQLLHILHRANKIVIPEVNFDEPLTFKNESRATVYLLESNLFEKLGNIGMGNVLNLEAPVASVTSSNKFVPLHKWGVTFDGQPNNVISFIERVEELALARNVSRVELFRSGLDLFSGPALQWYRSVRAGNEVRNWESLVEQLKNDFLHEDFNKSMLEYIEKRTQHIDEPVHIYIRIMEALYNRLKDKPCLAERLKQIKKNLLPYFATPLALLDFESVSDIISKCKKIEYAEGTTKKYVPPPARSNLVEKDLLYVGVSSPDTAASTSDSHERTVKTSRPSKQHFKSNLRRANVNVVEVNKVPVKCWNCKGENHVFKQCKARRSRFCFKCGEPNVTMADCKNCSKKRVRGMRRVSRRTQPRSGKVTSFKTNDSEWNSWLNTVKDFYKTYRKNNDQGRVAPLLLSRNGDDRPYISVFLYDKQITALVDSGCNRSVVGKEGIKILEKFKCKTVSSDLNFVTTADGAHQSVTGIAHLPFRIGNIVKVIKVYIVPSLTSSFILGIDFCRIFGIHLDFKTNTWKNYISSIEISAVCQVDTQFSDGGLANLTKVQLREVEGVKQLFRNLGDGKLGCTNKMIYHIDTGDAKPIRQRQYLLSPYMMTILNKELDQMLEQNVVEPTFSEWRSPVLLVTKGNGDYRFCFDGRALNSVTVKDSYPLPFVDGILSMLRNARYISSIDLKSAFWQIPLSENSKPKTAFAVPGRGLFCFRVVPFGLANAAQAMQRLMDLVITPKLEDKVFVYLDDIIVTASTFEEHVSILREVHERLRDANLTINIEKCQFFRNSLKYLGYVIDTEGGLRTNPEKVEAMVNYPRPTNTTQIKRFIGMCSWYRRFLPHFSTLVAPLNNLLKGKRGKRQPIKWNESSEQAFLDLKQALISTPILTSPDFKLNNFVIQCDSSSTGLGGALTQSQGGEEKVIAFASRSLNKAERNYSTYEQEILALLFCVERFRPFVDGQKFTVITDNLAVSWLHKLKSPTGRLARWMVKLQQYNFDIVHRKGSLNVVPDALSRATQDEQSSTKDDDQNFTVALLSVELENLDSWYKQLRIKILANPDLYPQFKVENNVIFKHVANKLPVKTNIVEWKLLVPIAQRTEVLKQNHDVSTSAHLGYFKTLKRICEEYYWPKMRRDILRYVKSCKICGSQKVSFSRYGLMGKEKEVEFPWQIVSADIFGPVTRSKRGYSYLLVVADWFTKYVLVHPMRSATAQAVSKFMENEVFLTYGVPQYIIVDNGKQFASSVFRKLAERYKVQKIWYNARYHPQVNPVERSNATIGAAIRSYIQDNHQDWDLEIYRVAHAIRTATHEVTGFPPTFLNFGRKVPISGDFYGQVDSTEGVQLAPGDRNKYADDISKLSDLYETVVQRLHDSYSKSQKTYNLRRRDIVYEVGDKVWKKNKVLSDASKNFSAKLAPKFVLCTVRQRLSKLVYALNNEDGSDAGSWHVSDLKEYFGSNSDISVG